ncbi:MAG: hypothetical protein EHM41_11325 [Chloroflexi bacterium]|nr:MAG: hypothetical protein EHM41_11325 [Chloroflexota bacterium]
MGELEQLKQAIATLESQRSFLGDAVIDQALGPMKEKLAVLQSAREPEQQRKLATLLFMDIAGHTAMTRHLDPEDVMTIIDRSLARLAEPVQKHHGKVVRFQGDGFKAVFGLPVANEDDPVNAVRAGLEIQAVSRDIAVDIERDWGLSGFAVRVGIATGFILAGGGNEGEDAVVGEPVNLAARMESAAQPGTVLIAQQTYPHVRGVFDLEPQEPIVVKGFSDPIQVYRVSAVRPRSFRTRRRGVEGIETRMVGRQAELSALQEVYSKVHGQSERYFVTIIGEPGLGKSRLLSEFEIWLNTQPAVARVFRGRARLETQRTPYSLLRDIFSTEFKISDNDSEADANEKLERGISEIIGSEGKNLAPFIGHLIGFNYTNSPHLSGILDDAQQIRDRAFTSSFHIFQSVMQYRPVLILLEDIHWSDEGSLDFFEQLAQACQEFPLMIISAARKTLFEQHPDWSEEKNGYIRIDLAPLTELESQELVEEILRNLPVIPPGIHDLIVSRAEGNPFYVEEVIKMMIDDGVIIPEGERWQVNEEKFVQGKIPQTLTGVLQARLDGLPGMEQAILHRASVAGRIFWDDLTIHLSDEEDMEEAERVRQTDAVLNTLQGKELIFRRDYSAFSGTTEFIFKHAVLRDVAYERLLKRFRRIYHAQVARWLYEHSGERVGEYAGRIGEHFERAGETDKAAQWYARAGKQAQDTYVPEMALEYYQKAISFWEKPVGHGENQSIRKMDVYQGMGHVLNWLGRYNDAIEAFQSMAGEAESSGDMLMRARAWHGIAEAQMHKGDTRDAIESAAVEESLAKAAALESEMTKALWMKAWGSFRIGDVETAFSLARRVNALSQEQQDRDQMAHSLNLLGVLESVSGHFKESADAFEQALEIFRELGNRRRAMPLMNNLGVIMESKGEYEEALKRYQEALITAREIGNRDGEIVYLSNQGGVKVRLEQFAEAENDLRQVIQMVGTSGSDILPSAYSFLAKAYLGQEKTDEALDAAQRALALAEEMELQEDLGVAWRALGRVAAYLRKPVPVEIVYTDMPRTADADGCFAESERIFKEIEREDERARTLTVWAKYKLDLGDKKRGLPMWEEAKQIFTQLGARSEVERMENIYAKE